jgi:hypothetical protein
MDRYEVVNGDADRVSSHSLLRVYVPPTYTVRSFFVETTDAASRYKMRLEP